MKKFIYQISFFAKSNEDALEKLISFAKQTPNYFGARELNPQEVKEPNIHFNQAMNSLFDSFHADQERKKKSALQEEEAKKFMSGIQMVEKVIQIIDRCVNDETAIDRIAQLFGINVKPQKTTLE